MKFSTLCLAAIVAGVLSAPAFSSVVVQGTRVIYPESAKEITVKMVNEGKIPLLVQSWMDDGHESGDPAQMKLPFIVTPPVSRLDPAKGQSVRITWTGPALPQDRESIYWFNVLEIPPKTAGTEGSSKLNLALRSRIKFFFRPKNLPGNFIEALNNVSWNIANNEITLKNASPYYLSIVGGNIWVGEKKYTYKAKMLSPFSEDHFAIPQFTSATVNKVSWTGLNDYGAVTEVVKTTK